MSERRPYKIQPRKKEWVHLSGGDLCLWSFTMAEQTAIEEYSMRPPEDPRGGYDLSEASLWQIAFAAYDGDGDDAKRVWPDLKVYEIRSMPAGDFRQLIIAINRLNLMDADGEAELRDFTPADTEPRTSPSRSGVCDTSTASPVS